VGIHSKIVIHTYPKIAASLVSPPDNRKKFRVGEDEQPKVAQQSHVNASMASLSLRLAASTATHSRIASGNGSTKSTMKQAANNSAGTESLASPSKKLRSISVGSTLTGKVSVDIDHANSARGKNLLLGLVSTMFQFQ
jgi:hypothetical protein